MKYMGSKSRIAKHIVPIIQEYIDRFGIENYIEPFVGGANVIDKISCKNRYGYDKNKYLIALLQRAQSGGELLSEVPKGLYDKIRTAYNNGDTSEFMDWEVGNVGFLASYNGRWFDGGYAKAGYAKVYGGYRDYYQEAKRNLLNQAPDLRGIQFGSSDYKEVVNTPYDYGAVIYCDPPYRGTKEYSNATSFNYEEFWDVIREWSDFNFVFISELDAPKDFKCIWQHEVSRSMKAAGKSTAIEKLFIRG